MKHLFPCLAFAFILAISCDPGKSNPVPKPDLPGVNLSSKGTANSYIVSEPGTYCFRTVKGNSNVSVGKVGRVDVLWETFGSKTKIPAGTLVSDLKYSSEYVSFNYTGEAGNALIAVWDENERQILWSWHIWCCAGNPPKGQVCYNNAGTVMDRNLGATSIKHGDVRCLGLLYQWGRKDPFIGSATITGPDPYTDPDFASSTIF